MGLLRVLQRHDRAHEESVEKSHSGHRAAEVSFKRSAASPL
jgi:hypothetical protein